jgi:hypothetical protein
MPKYKNAFFADLDKDDEDNTDLTQGTPDPVQNYDPDAATDPAPSTDGVDWEKRYSDLRRYQQTERETLMNENSELKRKVEEAAKEQIKLPKTKEEIEAWTQKYPEVAAVVDTIARMRAAEVAEQTGESLKELKRKEEESRRRTAYQELLELHPDFETIRSDQKFKDWVAEQPAYIYDALYKNATDVRAAARAIDLYKVDAKIASKPKKKSNPDADAARDVASGGSSAPTGKNTPKWSDSKVDALSDAEYDKYEAEIDEARRTGNYIYDLT